MKKIDLTCLKNLVTACHSCYEKVKLDMRFVFQSFYYLVGLLTEGSTLDRTNKK